ncbi:MAG: hypothetical protein RB191_15430 [Terriglobia bacterium]|nr:hypothetical protein [Terriglobia bacterium]
MRASIKMKADGSVALDLDLEAARAVFASVLFSARFHERIVPLVKVAKVGLQLNGRKSARRLQLCR